MFCNGHRNIHTCTRASVFLLTPPTPLSFAPLITNDSNTTQHNNSPRSSTSSTHNTPTCPGTSPSSSPPTRAWARPPPSCGWGGTTYGAWARTPPGTTCLWRGRRRWRRRKKRRYVRGVRGCVRLGVVPLVLGLGSQTNKRFQNNTKQHNTHKPNTQTQGMYVPEGYWSVDVRSVEVRTRDHARPGKGEVLVDVSSPSSGEPRAWLDKEMGGLCVWLLDAAPHALCVCM